MIEWKTGYIKDPLDTRDKLFRSVFPVRMTVSIPASATVRDDRIVVKNQRTTGSCTGQGIVQAVRMDCLKAGIDCPDLSALFSYYTNRAEWSGQFTDAGSYLRTGIKSGQRLGFASEATFPFSTATVNDSPPYSAYRDASKRRGVRGYYRVGPHADEVRRVLSAGHPVVGGWQVGDRFIEYTGRGIIPATPPGQSSGGHAVVIVGYNANGTFDILNSWGLEWGTYGYGAVDESFVESGEDMWAIVTQETL